MPDITFLAAKDIAEDKAIQPEPAKLHLPEWYKKIPLKLKHDRVGLTIKACMPFQDSLMAGYILKNPIDQQFNFLTPDEDGNEHISVDINKQLAYLQHNQLFYNINAGIETHPIEQLGGTEGGCPFVKMNADRAFYKIINPFSMILPPGYSVLFCPLINRPEPRFTVLSGIVDEGYDLPTNFPIVLRKKGTWLLKKGEPIVGVIPFKREKWKMNIKIKNKEQYESSYFQYATKLKRWYRDNIWKRKQWD
jgi:hypothetical protein